MFYGILYILYDESQKKVDEYIKKIIPDILILPGKDKFPPQTIITKIRNSIAHPDENINLAEITNNVDGYIETLKEIVLKILRK